MKTLLLPLAGLLFCTFAIADDTVLQLSKQLGKTPALVVVVCGPGEGSLATIGTIVEETPWTVFCVGGNSAGTDAIRNWAGRKGLLGQRVWVVEDDGESLWLAGEMADAVWLGPGADYSRWEKEILRVLHPGGVSLVEGRVMLKPDLADVDDWRHPYHGPNNNVLSKDAVARLPGELRFQTNPAFAPMPNQTLFAGGRVFFFTGHIAFHEREEPLLNTLTVLNAYNGLKLWSRVLEPTHVVHDIAKLATEGELVFAEGETLWMLDPATGDQRGKFAAPPAALKIGDTEWKWIVQQGDTLWAAFGEPDARIAPHKQKRQMGHWPWNVANDQYKSIVENFGQARTLAAFRYPEMKLLWSTSETEPFDARTLCMEGGRILQLAPEKYMAARDSTTGRELWRQTPETAKELFYTIGPAIKRQGWGLGWATYSCARAGNGVVCIAGPPFRKTVGVSFESGKLLWALDVPSPHPFFFNDEIYVMPRVGSPSAVCKRINPRSGETIDEFSLGVIGSCTRLTVTPNQFFYRPGGGEGRTVYVDLGTSKLGDYEGVVRPGCFDGVVPANGRLYWMPLACDCWQIHGTFSMAPRRELKQPSPTDESPDWAAPASTAPAAKHDWPMFRANSAGTATIPSGVGKQAAEAWRTRLPTRGLTAPVSAAGHVFVGGTDGILRAIDTANGDPAWQVASNAAIVHPAAYFNGRVVFGSCDGRLYCVDASDGRILGRIELAPEKRFINVMDRFISAWPLGGGVVLDHEGIVYTAAGCTAADGCVAAAVDLATGKLRWRQAYTLDREDPKLSFGVQANLLLVNNRLYINGGPPVGIVSLDASSGRDPQVAARLDAGMEMYLEPDGRPSTTGPELFGNEPARTTIFKRHQGRVYFQLGDRRIALVDGRVFCSRDQAALDRVVELMNQDPKTGKKLGGGSDPRKVMTLPVDESLLWASDTADILGLAIGTDGIVLLHQTSVEAVSLAGKSLWTAALPAPPVRWGLALTAKHCTVTLADGQVVCFDK